MMPENRHSLVNWMRKMSDCDYEYAKNLVKKKNASLIQILRHGRSPAPPSTSSTSHSRLPRSPLHERSLQRAQPKPNECRRNRGGKLFQTACIYSAALHSTGSFERGGTYGSTPSKGNARLEKRRREQKARSNRKETKSVP